MFNLEELTKEEVENIEYTSSEKKTYNPNKFTRKPEVLEDPYIPVVVYIDRDIPIESKDRLISIASKFIRKKITVRVNGDEPSIVSKLTSLSTRFVEVYIPWKGFNDIDSKHYYNTLTSKEIAKQHFAGWDKVPDSVKSILARNVRLIFGDKNNSIALCLITWSKDGASNRSEVTKETGRHGVVIKLASTYGFPVINLEKQNTEAAIEKIFNL